MRQLLSKFAKALTRNPVVVLLIAVLLLIPCAIGAIATRVNYDILSYLPDNLDSTRGEQILENTFHDAATSFLVLDNMESKDVTALKEKIKQVPGVNQAVWVDDVTDISVPKDMLPDAVKNVLYSDNEKSTLMLITYDGSTSSEETLTAIGNIKKLLNKQCFLSGFSAIVRDTRELADQEIPIYVALAVLLSLAAMTICMESWLLPFVFMIGIFFAVVYNFGTNIFLGQISYITKAIAAILQLGVTMDYSIFLINRYDEEKPKFEDRRDAMASAIQSTFLSLAGSSMTTVAGFFALCFMNLGLGKDIGIVMMKGVVLGVFSTVTILPSLILLFDKPIHRYTHRSLFPDFTKTSEFLLRHRRGFVLLGLVLILPAAFCKENTQMYYNLDQSLPKDLDSIVALNRVKEDFNMATTHFIILDDDLKAYQVKQMSGEIKALDGVENVFAYEDFVGPSIPDDFIPDSIQEICKKDGKQILMVNSSYQSAEDAENEQISQISRIVKNVDPGAMVTGEGALTKDLIEMADHDFKVTNYISMGCILLIILLVFQSAAIPVFLVAIIELAIYINLGIPYLTGTVIPFITPTVIGCVQLGATVDYSILVTTRFQEELKAGHDRREAIRIASSTSIKSIVTSALVFFCATSGVALVSKIEIIQSICSMLARGSIISAAVIIFILPCVLYVTEPLINKLSRHWKQA